MDSTHCLRVTELRFVCVSLGNWEGKSTKCLSGITLTDSVKEIGKGWGAGGVEHGFYWYAGI